MGAQQSSHTYDDTNPSYGKVLHSVRGRKTEIPEAPHGLEGSIVSEPSNYLFASEDLAHLIADSGNGKVDVVKEVSDEDSSDDETETDDEEDEEWGTYLCLDV